MLQSHALSLLSLLPVCVSAVRPNYRENLTVSFFPNDNLASCQSNDTSKGLTFTTGTLPNSATCFNVDEIFSQSEDFGFQNASMRVYNTAEPNGVYWRLENRDQFDSNANYSRIWFRQHSFSGEAGDDAPWLFSIYAFEDCQQIEKGASDDVPEDANPWYLQSCATEDGGNCRTVPYSIRSFMVNDAKDFNEHDCARWMFKGDSKKDESIASVIGGRAPAMVAGIASVAVLFLLL